MVELKPLTAADVDAHNAGEDQETVRWLTGEFGSVESTLQHFSMLVHNAQTGEGKQGFGVWLESRLAGYVDCDPDANFLPASGDVNIAYAVHPWARRRGVATAAVEMICNHISREGIGTRAIARVEAGNIASARVVEASGFQLIDDSSLTIETDKSGSSPIYAIYARDLEI